MIKNMSNPLSFSSLLNVNSSVNSQITYTPDLQQFGKDEHWEIAQTHGDCEDYALRKRKVLLDKGVPLSALRLATCWTETNEYHAVLIVVTPNGDYVLDNRMTNPMIKQDLNYKWDKIQIGSKWHKL